MTISGYLQPGLQYIHDFNAYIYNFTQIQETYKNRLILHNETFDTKIMVLGLKNLIELFLSHAVS